MKGNLIANIFSRQLINKFKNSASAVVASAEKTGKFLKAKTKRKTEKPPQKRIKIW